MPRTQPPSRFIGRQSVEHVVVKSESTAPKFYEKQAHYDTTDATSEPIESQLFPPLIRLALRLVCTT